MQTEDQILEKVTAINRDLKSLRLTFGIVLIVLIGLLGFASPTIIRTVFSTMPYGSNQMSAGNYGHVPSRSGDETPAVVPAATPAGAPAASTSKQR